MNQKVFTQEGYDKLKEEIKVLKTVERGKCAKAIAEARAKGDLSENAEFDAARDELGKLEAKIAMLEGHLANGRIINKEQLDSSKVCILSKVKIKNRSNGAVISYTIVPEGEANLQEGKISSTSPIGKGLIGKKIGEIATIIVPAGSIEFELLSISIEIE